MQKAWQAWTFMDFGPKRSVQDGRPEGGSRRRAAPAWRLAQFGFSARGGRWRLENRGMRVRGRGACSQYDPKVIVGAKTLDPKCDAYCGS